MHCTDWKALGPISFTNREEKGASSQTPSYAESGREPMKFEHEESAKNSISAPTQPSENKYVENYNYGVW